MLYRESEYSQAYVLYLTLLKLRMHYIICYSLEPNQAGSCLNKQVVFNVRQPSVCGTDVITCSVVAGWNPVEQSQAAKN
jgi:hypothetical protein